MYGWRDGGGVIILPDSQKLRILLPQTTSVTSGSRLSGLTMRLRSWSLAHAMNTAVRAGAGGTMGGQCFESRMSRTWCKLGSFQFDRNTITTALIKAIYTLHTRVSEYLGWIHRRVPGLWLWQSSLPPNYRSRRGNLKIAIWTASMNTWFLWVDVGSYMATVHILYYGLKKWLYHCTVNKVISLGK